MENEYKPYYAKDGYSGGIVYIVYSKLGCDWNFHYKIHLHMHGDEVIIPYKKFIKIFYEREEKLKRILYGNKNIFVRKLKKIFRWKLR